MYFSMEVFLIFSLIQLYQGLCRIYEKFSVFHESGGDQRVNGGLIRHTMKKVVKSRILS